MRNIFKLLIPSGETKGISELESWTVSWNIATSRRWGDAKYFNKCFIIEKEANDFKKALEDAALFVKTPIWTDIVKN